MHFEIVLAVGITVLAVGILVSFAANLLHWHFRTGEKFHYHTPNHKLLALEAVVIVALVVFPVLFLAGIVPSAPFICSAFAYVVWQEMYSIWFRHHQRHEQKIEQKRGGKIYS